MGEFYDWSDEAVAPWTPSKDKQREELAALVDEFLAFGGAIEKVAYDPIPEMIGGVATLKRKWPTEEGMTKATPTE